MNRLSRNRTGIFGLTFLLSAGGLPTMAGTVHVIDDKSDFTGADFTVIDFETRPDGTPWGLSLGSGLLFESLDYASEGVRVSASPSMFTTPHLAILNDASLLFGVALDSIGSPFHTIFDTGVSFLRFDFIEPVNTVGLALAHQREVGDPSAFEPFLELFDVADQLVGSVAFNDLLDGTVHGSDYGDPFLEVDHGFFGAYVPGGQVSYAILNMEFGRVDDIHFGIVPEPGAILLLTAAGGFAILHRRKRKIPCILALALLSTAASAVQAATISGQVTGFVVVGPKPICGPNPPPGCVNPPFAEAALEGVRVCLPDLEVCTFTGAGRGSPFCVVRSKECLTCTETLRRLYPVP